MTDFNPKYFSELVPYPVQTRSHFPHCYRNIGIGMTSGYDYGQVMSLYCLVSMYRIHVLWGHNWQLGYSKWRGRSISWLMSEIIVNANRYPWWNRWHAPSFYRIKFSILRCLHEHDCKYSRLRKTKFFGATAATNKTSIIYFLLDVQLFLQC